MRKECVETAIATLAVCVFSASMVGAQTSDAENPVSPGPAVPPAQQPPSVQPQSVVQAPSYRPMPYNPAYDPSSREHEERPKPRWYGWQTLVADGAALAALMVGASYAAKDSPLSGMGLGIYLLGAPTVHMVHDRAGVGLASFGMRVAAPVVGAAIGVGMADCDSSREDRGWCGMNEGAVGLLIGAGAAIAIDAAVLARKPAPERRRIATAPRLAPAIALTPERRALVLSGTF